jgi:hypothetical protein
MRRQIIEKASVKYCCVINLESWRAQKPFFKNVTMFYYDVIKKKYREYILVYQKPLKSNNKNFAGG